MQSISTEKRIKISFLRKNDPSKNFLFSEKIKKMILWIESEKFRAELLKAAGLGLCTPLSANLLIYLTDTDFSLLGEHLPKSIISVLMFFNGLIVFHKAHEVLLKLDVDKGDRC